MRFSARPIILKRIVIAIIAGILAPGAAFSQPVAPTPLEQAAPDAPTAPGQPGPAFVAGYREYDFQ